MFLNLKEAAERGTAAGGSQFHLSAVSSMRFDIDEQELAVQDRWVIRIQQDYLSSGKTPPAYFWWRMIMTSI